MFVFSPESEWANSPVSLGIMVWPATKATRRPQPRRRVDRLVMHGLRHFNFNPLHHSLDGDRSRHPKLKTCCAVASRKVAWAFLAFSFFFGLSRPAKVAKFRAHVYSQVYPRACVGSESLPTRWSKNSSSFPPRHHATCSSSLVPPSFAASRCPTTITTPPKACLGDFRIPYRDVSSSKRQTSFLPAKPY